jgi:hypothetical protein
MLVGIMENTQMDPYWAVYTPFWVFSHWYPPVFLEFTDLKPRITNPEIMIRFITHTPLPIALLHTGLAGAAECLRRHARSRRVARPGSPAGPPVNPGAASACTPCNGMSALSSGPLSINNDEMPYGQ